MKKSEGGCGGGGAKADTSAQDGAIDRSLSRIKNKLIVMSGKGGVGKTSVSVHLAASLAKKGYKVGLMDVDIHGPDVPRMLGLKEMLDLNEEQKLLPVSHSDNLKAVSIESLSVAKDDAIIWRGPIKYQVIRQFIADVEWGDLDFLVVDCPPGTGDEPLTVAQVIKDARAVIVTTPQEVSLADVRKSIDFCRTVNMKIFGLVENMSGFACPHCNARMELFGSGGGERTAKQADIPFLGRIPFDPEVVANGDGGEIVKTLESGSPVAQAFLAVADKVAERAAG